MSSTMLILNPIALNLSSLGRVCIFVALLEEKVYNDMEFSPEILALLATLSSKPFDILKFKIRSIQYLWFDKIPFLNDALWWPMNANQF